MQFDRLRLSGFKSFVDPTELVIRDGLTGVVGPNRCGKSNLLEALRWVMGESRPTAMRGDGMEDVIFAGTARRPARGQAEVTLALDNRARRAPAGFNDSDTLDVTRRITRDPLVGLLAAAAMLLTPQLLLAEINDFHPIVVCTLPMALIAWGIETDHRKTIALGAALALGAAVGLERQWRQRLAGL